MKLSEYIARLQALKADQGDVDVVVRETAALPGTGLVFVKEAGNPKLVDLYTQQGSDYMLMLLSGNTIREDQHAMYPAVGKALLTV
jgi:hypothetical protein